MVATKIDVLIIGAGPAGLSAAHELAVAGREVMVVDKTRVLGRKVCSGILPYNPEVQAMGIPESIIRTRSTKLSLTTVRGTRNISYAQEPRISFTREALGEWMAEQAKKAGAQIRIGVKIKRIEGQSAITDQNKSLSP